MFRRSRIVWNAIVIERTIERYLMLLFGGVQGLTLGYLLGFRALRRDPLRVPRINRKLCRSSLGILPYSQGYRESEALLRSESN